MISGMRLSLLKSWKLKLLMIPVIFVMERVFRFVMDVTGLLI